MIYFKTKSSVKLGYSSSRVKTKYLCENGGGNTKCHGFHLDVRYEKTMMGGSSLNRTLAFKT